MLNELKVNLWADWDEEEARWLRPDDVDDIEERALLAFERFLDQMTCEGDSCGYCICEMTDQRYCYRPRRPA